MVVVACCHGRGEKKRIVTTAGDPSASTNTAVVGSFRSLRHIIAFIGSTRIREHRRNRRPRIRACPRPPPLN
uniref:Uncharacterized protein n=1 Tax=Oryza sativa subsp. japonica TaxID=39947 RepID=Q6ET35_ORYSJ|nr:hypothetical protein [Oryza sativa Japonica Group]